MRKSSLSINLFARGNYQAVPVLFSTLLEALEELDFPISLNIFTSDQGAEHLRGKLPLAGQIKLRIVDSYWGKALRTYLSPAEVIVKVDDDIFMDKNSWLLFLASAMKSESDVLLSPVITTGLPSVELFVQHYLTDSEAEEVRELFDAVVFPNSLWGVDYSTLNFRYRLGLEQFLRAVKALPTDYLGIHPVRISPEAQARLLQLGLKALDRGIVQQVKDDLEESTSYFCNNVFSLHRSSARKLIRGFFLRRFRFDGYDELGINWLISRGFVRHYVIKKALAIHPSFNSAPGFESLRSDMVANLETRIINKADYAPKRP